MPLVTVVAMCFVTFSVVAMCFFIVGIMTMLIMMRLEQTLCAFFDDFAVCVLNIFPRMTFARAYDEKCDRCEEYQAA